MTDHSVREARQNGGGVWYIMCRCGTSSAGIALEDAIEDYGYHIRDDQAKLSHHAYLEQTDAAMRLLQRVPASKVAYLIVDSFGDMKIRKTPTLAWNEVAYKVTVHVPDSWGRVLEPIEITVPDAPPSLIVNSEPDYVGTSS